MLSGVSKVATETCVCAGFIDREQEAYIWGTLLHVVITAMLYTFK